MLDSNPVPRYGFAGVSSSSGGGRSSRIFGGGALIDAPCRGFADSILDSGRALDSGRGLSGELLPCLRFDNGTRAGIREGLPFGLLAGAWLLT